MADRGRPDLEVRLDQLELAFAERREVEQLVDRDVLFDRAQDHPGRADQLVDPEMAEERSFLGLLTRAIVLARRSGAWPSGR